MIWALLFLVIAAVAPFVREALRKPMSDAVRSRAPGHFARLSQGQTHYDWIGPARGPVAVCVHGLTTPSFVYRGLAPLLVRLGFRVLIYDLYGRGFSDRPTGRQDTAFFLRQLDELLDDQGIAEPVTFVGYSMGGAIVTAFAARRPDQVQRLILLAPAGIEIARDWIARAACDLPFIGDWVFHAFWPGAFRAGVLADTLPSSVDNIAARQVDELDQQGFVPAVLSSLRGKLSERQDREHGVVADNGIPVIAIWGRADTVIPLRAMGTLTQWNRDARHEVVEGAAHGLPYTHPEDVAQAVSAALADGL